MSIERMEQVLREKNTSFIIAEYDEVVIEVMHDIIKDSVEDAMMVSVFAAMIKAKLLERKGVI